MSKKHKTKKYEWDEKFIHKNAAELCKQYDKIHGASINVARITDDIVDGLKPVQRRAIYTMYLKDGGKSYQKLATIGGNTIAYFHPHSPDSVTDSVVGMAQSWNNILPLIDGSGNFGLSSGEPAAAPRYITARLSDYCRACFFDDWRDAVVDMKPSYNGEYDEPEYLPAKYPNILLNGCLGIGLV